MKFHKFKPYVKCGLFLLLVIILAGTANAATNHTGGIALSWDDALSIDPCSENLPMFNSYNATCTINVNTLSTGEGTIDNLRALHSAGWEIAAHGQNHADSIAFLKNYTSEVWLGQEILPNIAEITGYGYTAYSFAYPYSERNVTTDALLAPYFRTIRSTAFETMSGTDVNKSDAYYKWDDTQVLYAVEIDDNSGATLESIQYGIDEAIQNGTVLLLYGHTITPTVPGDYQTSTSRLESILNYTYQNGGKFYHLEDLGNSSWVQPSISSNVTANFTVSKDSVTVGESVTFVDYSINQTSELLDFGDGSATSSTANVTHTYTTPGPHTATLTVTNGVSSHSMTKTITVVTGYKGGIALSWDDTGNIDPCYENIQMFNTYNATCTVNLNSLSVSPQSTKENLSELNSAGWEISAHGLNHLDPIVFLNNHTSQEWLDQEILPNIAEITGYGYPVYSFAYPYGSQNDTTDALLAPYFRTLRATNFGTVNVNESAAYYKWDNARLVYAIEIDDQSNISLESIQYGIDDAIKYGYVLVLYGHTINSSDSPGPYQTSTSKLESILNYTSQKGGKFYHMGDLGNSSWVQPSTVTANFTVSTDSVTAGENVTFVDYSINQTSELLDFGDGSTNSSTANVVHTYTTPGTYTATLMVTNGVSSHSMNKTITVAPTHKGGIALSWDDTGNIDPCYENIQMFNTYNATCTVNLNSLSVSPQSTKDNLNALNSAGWEISAHGLNHEDPVAFLNSHTSQEWLDQEILPNIAEITGYGYSAYSFAYPYGSNDNTTNALLAPYFRTLRSTAFGIVDVNTSEAYYKWDNSTLVYGVEIDDQSPCGASLESIQYGIDYAIQNGYVLVLYGHTINSSDSPGPYQTSTARLDAILNYTYQKGGKFYHMGDLGNSSWVQPSISSNVTANFVSNPTTGFAPLNVAFTDTSTGLPTSWSWDFGDGATSTEQNPTHTYPSAGTYTVSLTASNANSTSSKTAPIIVDEEDDDGGSSHSSGGGGGSPEPARNVEVKELSQVFITNGKAVKFDFTKNATCVVYVGFDAKKTVGKTTTIAEQLKGKSSLVSELPSDEVYKSFNIWVGNSGFASSKNIENPVICFKVEKSWIQDKKIDQDSITLNRYNDKKWEQIPASLLREDEEYLYFTVETPGFSSFAITGKANTSPEETVTEIQSGDESDNSEENTEDTGSEANQESKQGGNSIPGFYMVYGIAGLLAVFLYKRR